MGVFNSKNFNSEIFGQYLETVPRVKQNAMLKAGILRSRPELKSLLTEQTGGNYISVPMTGLIGGSVLNYDGSTDITATGLETFLQSMIVVGRAKAWEEKDFSQDITGKDFMEEIGAQVAQYWDDVDQATILATLKGIFGVSDNNFSTDHTHNIIGASTATVGATSLNDAIQKAAGANKNLFTMAIMHSVVATNLENQSLLNYIKGTDANGIQRDLGLATWNGRAVLIDDDVPTNPVVGTPGVYTMTVGTKAIAGDKLSIFGVEYTFVANSATPTATQIQIGSTPNSTEQAANIKAKLSALTTGPATKYTITDSSNTVVFTQKTTSYGYHQPTISVTKTTNGTLAATMAETTASSEYIEYTTYIFGQNAFDYCDCGAAVPSEAWRDPKSSGGKEWLITRQRKVYAPRGFSFKQNTSIVSPTDDQLETDTNWGVVKDTAGTGYFDSKAIPFARIISKG